MQSPTLKLNAADIKEKDFSALIKNVTIIPLETHPDALISRVDKIQFHDSTIYVSQFSTGKVLQFDAKGKFVRFFAVPASRGGDDFMLSDFNYDGNLRRLELLAAQGKLVAYHEADDEYDETFSYVGPITPTYCFLRLDGELLVFFTKYKTHTLTYFNEGQDGPIAQYLRTPDQTYIDWYSEEQLVSWGDDFYYVDDFNNTIYRLTSEGPEVTERIEFTDREFKPSEDDIAELEGGKPLFDLLGEQKVIYPITRYFSNDQTLLVQAVENGKINRSFVKDVKSGTFYKFTLQAIPTSHPHRAYFNGRHIATLNDPTRVDQFTLPRSAESRLSNLSEEDNPVIVKYNFRWEE